ncbi:MAG: hypothetical protein ABR956_03295 [Terracidiphilus sp.]|jgi:hypothetical protein
MSLIKKIDVPKHFAARRAKARAAARLGTEVHATGAAEMDLAGTKANAAGFVEDFSMEHSLQSPLVPPKA